MEAITISGYGRMSELTLDEAMFRDIESRHGKLIGLYPVGEGHGGNIMGDFLNDNGPLQGYLAEYEQAFFVVWSCGEYIDAAFFLKSEREEL